MKLENKVLYINTDSSVWSNHLLLMKKQFLKNINGALKKRSVSDLKFVNGSVDNEFLKDSASETKPEKLNCRKKNGKNFRIGRKRKNTGLQLKLMAFKAAALKREKALLKHGGKNAAAAAPLLTEKSIYVPYAAVMNKKNCMMNW